MNAFVMNAKWRAEQWNENFQIWVARHLPLSIRRRVVACEAGRATSGKWSGQEVPSLTVIDLMKRMDE